MPKLARSISVCFALVLLGSALTGSNGSASPRAQTASGRCVVRVTVDGEGVLLTWSDMGAETSYMVESCDAVADKSWLAPAPASLWPAKITQWRDTRPLSGTRFYRVMVWPAEVQRGKLISASELRSLSTAEIETLFGEEGIPLSPENAVRVYKLVYETVDPFHARTIASGALVLPQNPNKALPLASYQHGTIAKKTDAPSALEGEIIIGLALASTGYAAALPDFLGLGDSPGLHPYHHSKTEATATIDLLRAARAFCAQNSIMLNGQLFLLGYSQGGHATMAAHKEIEEFHSSEFTITASAPMAGAYDLSGVTAADLLSGRSMPNPYYYAYLLAAYQDIYRFAGSLSEVLASPYAQTLPPLLDGNHDGSQINQAMGTSVPTRIMKPEFLNAFKTDANHPLRIALRENDLYNWTPRAPLRLYHCRGDKDVIFANSQVAYDSFVQRGATQVRLVVPFPLGDHGLCAPFSLLTAKVWFDELKK